MTDMSELSECPKFTVRLKERSSKKRLLEARGVLSGLYPFALEDKFIYVSKSKESGMYDVYLLESDFKRKAHYRKWVVSGIVILAVILCISLVYRYNLKQKSESVLRQKEKAERELEEKRIQKEKEEKLLSLQNEYNHLESALYEKVYSQLEKIYSVMTAKSVIENLSITGNAFSVEVTTPDAVEILKRFENSSVFSEIRMKRTTVKKGSETVIYEGKFLRGTAEAESYLSLDEKILFYSSEIERINKREELRSSQILSEYINGIRKVLHENKCSEQYIQISSGDKSAEVEFFVTGSSGNLLKFLSGIQEGEENLTDIKQVKIRNSAESNGVQMTVFFDSGISGKQNDGEIPSYENRKIPASEIDRIFYKAPVRKQAGTNISSVSKIKVEEKRKAVPLKNLSYIGLTRSAENTLILAKDDEMGTIYKFLLSENEGEENTCVETESGYRAKSRGQYYEVKR